VAVFVIECTSSALTATTSRSFIVRHVKLLHAELTLLQPIKRIFLQPHTAFSESLPFRWYIILKQSKLLGKLQEQKSTHLGSAQKTSTTVFLSDYTGCSSKTREQAGLSYQQQMTLC
jgi:hypothetical protein